MNMQAIQRRYSRVFAKHAFLVQEVIIWHHIECKYLDDYLFENIILLFLFS